MATSVTSRISNEKGVLSLSGRFDFSIHRDFRANYESLLNSKDVHEIEVDLSGVDYIDSSALGMLLLLREKATEKNIQMTLINPKEAVRQVLEVANFGRLFNIA